MVSVFALIIKRYNIQDIGCMVKSLWEYPIKNLWKRIIVFFIHFGLNQIKLLQS